MRINASGSRSLRVSKVNEHVQLGRKVKRKSNGNGSSDHNRDRIDRSQPEQRHLPASGVTVTDHRERGRG